MADSDLGFRKADGMRSYVVEKVNQISPEIDESIGRRILFDFYSARLRME